MAGVERSEPPGPGVSGGSLALDPGHPKSDQPNLELLCFDLPDGWEGMRLSIKGIAAVLTVCTAFAGRPSGAAEQTPLAEEILRGCGIRALFGSGAIGGGKEPYIGNIRAGDGERLSLPGISFDPDQPDTATESTLDVPPVPSKRVRRGE